MELKMKKLFIHMEFILFIVDFLIIKQSNSTTIRRHINPVEMAQLYCASVGSGWVFAIQRRCWKAPTCTEMCADAKQEILSSIGNQRKQVRCFDAFRFQQPTVKAKGWETEPFERKVKFATYGYGGDGCSWRANHCGLIKSRAPL